MVPASGAKNTLIAIILAALALSAFAPYSRGEIGGEVKDFEVSAFFREAGLEFYNLAQLAQGKHKYDGYYYLSKKTEEVYLAELITERGSRLIVWQSLHFPDDPKKWDIFEVAGFVNEAAGGGLDQNAILDKLRLIFREIVTELNKSGERYSTGETYSAAGTLGGYDIMVKRTPAGDWVITIMKQASHI